MKNGMGRLPVVTVLVEQLLSIALGNYEGPGTAEDALTLIERIVERSKFTGEDTEFLQSKLTLAREAIPRQVSAPTDTEVSKTPRRDNPFYERFGIK